jgi:allophanate hydrolase
VLAVAAVFDPLDPWSRRAPAPVAARWPPRIGVPPAAALRDLDDRHAAAWEEARARAGEMLVEIDFAPFAEAATLLYDGPWLAERWLAAGAAIDAEVDGLDPIVAGVVRRGREARATDLFRAVHRLAELRREVERTFAEVDVLLLPTAPTVPTPADVAADPVGVNRRLGAWTNGVNLLDLCALAVPGPAADGGPPFGVSLVAPAFSEPLLVELGAWWTGEASMPAPRAAGTEILLAVVGAHLRGEPLNGELTGRGARFVRATRTAPDYRLVALPGGPPERPGLLRAPGEAGPGIELELWSLSPAALGSLLAGVPAPLVIGTVELEDGGTVLGFLCEAHAAAAALDITEHGGWRAYRRAPASSAA